MMNGLNTCTCLITTSNGWNLNLRFNIPVNNFSVMSGRRHSFLGFKQYSEELMQGHNTVPPVGTSQFGVPSVNFQWIRTCCSQTGICIIWQIIFSSAMVGLGCVGCLWITRVSTHLHWYQILVWQSFYCRNALAEYGHKVLKYQTDRK